MEFCIAGIDLASQQIRGSFRRHEIVALPKEPPEVFHPRNLYYDASIIVCDLVSLQTRHGRLP
jgi:hypothetical protein